MLETARDNDVILLCLASHTTSAIQPLDVSVFGPYKQTILFAPIDKKN